MKTIRRCEIVSNLKDGDKILFDMENMKKVLEEKEYCISDYSYIVHDKDTYSEEDERRNPDHKCGELKKTHIHLLLRFEQKQPQKAECVAKWFGIKENFVNKIHGKWEDACLYQIHRNAPDKFQYPIDEVCCNFDFESLANQTGDSNPALEIVKKILSGEIREYNKTLAIDKMLLVSCSKMINEAFKVRSEYLQATVKDRDMQCIFITGGSSVGKTTFAKQIARENNMDFFVSSGSNDILDGYAQEPVIILDDIRPSGMGLSDLLKMLDNHTASSVKSRYKNKFLNCELIILTTVLDIDTFYNNVFSEHDEPVMQLKRRCGTYIRMDKDTINVSMWNAKTMEYTRPITYVNNIIERFVPKAEVTYEDVQKHVADFIPFLELAGEPAFHNMTAAEQMQLPFTE